MNLSPIISAINLSVIAARHPRTGGFLLNSQMELETIVPTLGVIVKAVFREPWYTSQIKISYEFARLFKRTIPVKTVLASQHIPKMATDTLVTSPATPNIFNLYVKKMFDIDINKFIKELFSSTSEVSLIPPIALIGVCIPVGLVLVVIRDLYANHSDPFYEEFYGIKHPGGEINPHKRYFYIEFLLPNWTGNPGFLEPLYAKHPTVPPSHIFSDYLTFRRELEPNLHIAPQLIFGVVFFPISLTIVFAVSKNVIVGFTPNPIILTLVVYVFTVALTKQAIIVAISSSSFTFKRIASVCSSLIKTIFGARS